MKRHFSAIKAQQAPAPRHARLLEALQTASKKAQRTTGGTVTARKPPATNVRTALNTPLNRLERSQQSIPEAVGGGGSTAIGSSRGTSVIGGLRPWRAVREEPLSAHQEGEGGARRVATGG